MRNGQEWFGEWFDSPYYHILYKDRDYTEAHSFIDNISNYLNFDPSQKIMDLACGKGRHSIYLNKKGFNVVGLDLSPANVKFAIKYSNDRLQFFEHDMRNIFRENEFDYVLNMFTSFGYFNTEQENQLAISNVAKGLKTGGQFILDFLNPYKVIHHLTPEEIKIKEGIEFHITKEVNNEGYIIKNIKFDDIGSQFSFQEKVKAIRRKEFLLYFDNAGLEVEEIFGDYFLSPYDCDHSERMIFIAKK
ncbi:MAG: class I SAM-dependent methyltransferase [Cyclobacteriaceae bacterium]|nr:class I SAM-dependent methyltransferase [Cyclobacteriaceae bacterium]